MEEAFQENVEEMSQTAICPPYSPVPLTSVISVKRLTGRLPGMEKNELSRPTPLSTPWSTAMKVW
jgi:hypothetical protein